MPLTLVATGRAHLGIGGALTRVGDGANGAISGGFVSTEHSHQRAETRLGILIVDAGVARILRGITLALAVRYALLRGCLRRFLLLRDLLLMKGLLLSRSEERRV